MVFIFVALLTTVYKTIYLYSHTYHALNRVPAVAGSLVAVQYLHHSMIVYQVQVSTVGLTFRRNGFNTTPRHVFCIKDPSTLATIDTTIDPVQWCSHACSDGVAVIEKRHAFLSHDTWCYTHATMHTLTTISLYNIYWTKFYIAATDVTVWHYKNYTMLQIHVASHITTYVCSTRRTLLKISSTLLSSLPG